MTNFLADYYVYSVILCYIFFLRFCFHSYFKVRQVIYVISPNVSSETAKSTNNGSA
jgi:hypothetical protein